MMNHATVINREAILWTPLRVTLQAQDKLTGVEVLGARYSLTPKDPLRSGIPHRDFNCDWQELHKTWKGSNKESVRAHPAIAAYCKLYEQIGLKPKETPPSILNIIQRFLLTESLERTPRINTIVDSVNVAAVDRMIPLGVFDASCVEGELVIDIALGGESYIPLGSSTSMEIKSGVVVLRDNEKILSQFCYRDSEAQKVTSNTEQIWLLGCKVPGIHEEAVIAALYKAKELLERDFILQKMQ